MDYLFDNSMNSVQKLKRIIHDNELLNVYEEYLKKLFAWENFGFYYAVETFKSASCQEEMQKLAWDIYNFYLDENAIFKLGSVGEVDREAIYKKLDEPDERLFDKVQMDALIELANSTINEFIDDDLLLEYKSFVDRVPTIKPTVSSSAPQPSKNHNFSDLFLDIGDNNGEIEHGAPTGFLASFHQYHP